jgi:hypothetical protein
MSDVCPCGCDTMTKDKYEDFMVKKAEEAQARKDSAIADVLKAWRDPGPHPPFHKAAQDKLLREWSTLYYALRRLDLTL